MAPSSSICSWAAASAALRAPQAASRRASSACTALVPAGRGPRRMAGQVGQFHRHAREAGAGPVLPAGRGGPTRHAVEQLIHQLARAAGFAHPARHLGQHEAMLVRQHRACQVVLAAHMIVERALGDPRLGRDVVQARALEALAIEQRICRGINARAGGGGIAGHDFLALGRCILTSVYTVLRLRPTIVGTWRRSCLTRSPSDP